MAKRKNPVGNVTGSVKKGDLEVTITTPSGCTCLVRFLQGEAMIAEQSEAGMPEKEQENVLKQARGIYSSRQGRQRSRVLKKPHGKKPEPELQSSIAF